MKRIPAMLLGASSLLLLLAAASCTDTLVGRPDTDDRTITFQTPQTDTRAVVENGQELPADFQVWGWHGTDGTNTDNIFDATVVSKDAGWNYTDGVRYWKAGETYNFYAVYPVFPQPTGEGDTQTTSTVTTGGTITVTNFDCSQTGDKAVDLMTAIRTDVVADDMIAGDGTVTLTFRHELARVTCDVKSVNSAVTVSSIKLYGVQYKGNLTGSGQWNDQEICSLANTPFNNSFVLNVDNQFSCTNALNDLLLLPQTFGQDVAAGFQLTYRYNGDQADRTATASIPVGTDWTAGQSYKYTITLKAAQLSLEVTVQEWDEKETSVSW